MSKKKMIAGLVLCAGAPVMAQVNDVAPNADVDIRVRSTTPTDALGDPVAGPYNVENGGNNGQLGVDHAWGHFWVSARDAAATNHQIWKYDESGNFVKAFDQDIASKASAWGYRDGASDDDANQLYFGWDSGGFAIHDYDAGTGDISVNCAMTVPGVSTIRALAVSPQGTFITKSFGGPIYEFDTSPAMLNTWSDPMSSYGCAYDAANDTYWWSNAGHFVEETDTSMLLTGRFIDTFAGFTLGAAQGGLDIYADARSRSGDAFVQLYQGTPDEISIFEADAGASARQSTGPVACPGPPPCEAVEIGAMTVPASQIDMDALAVGPTTVGDLNAAGTPGPADIGRINTPPNGAAAGVYNTNISLGNALAAVGGALTIIDAGGSAAFDATSFEITFNSPHTEFGFEIGDWNGPALVDLYDGANLVGSMTTSTTALVPQFVQVRGTGGCTFDRANVAIQAGGNFVLTQIWTQATGPACPCACNFNTTTGINVCDIFDFLDFQNGFVGGDPCACDINTTTGIGVCDIFDFLDFQNGFVQGCP